jgi:ketosteroid isomerase-like protein
MAQTSIAVFISLLLMASQGPAIAQETSPEDEVRAAVAAFGRAFEKADVAFLETRLTNDYIHVNGRSGSVLNRDEWLKWLSSRQAELKSGELSITSYSVEDLKVQVYGEAAVATGIVRSSGQWGGTEFTSQVRFTNLWVMQGGEWRRAAFHDSPLPESGP